MGLGMVATAGAGVLSLAAMMNPTFAHADDIGLVIGGSGDPIPGSDYVAAANELYIHSIYPDTTYPDPYANGVFTPEGLSRTAARG